MGTIQPGYTTYDPDVRMYYGHIPNSLNNTEFINNKYRLSPAPFIDISTNFTYANDTIIGYTYTVNLNGTVSSLDLREEFGTKDQEYAYKPYTNKNAGAFIDSIHKIRTTLTKNGGVLIVKDKSNRTILKATGGILKSFDVSASKWIDTSAYTATLEFNYIEFMGNKGLGEYSLDDTNNTFMSDDSYPSDDDPDSDKNAGILNFKKYKLKDFEDSWKIKFSQEGMNNFGYADPERREGEDGEGGAEQDLGFNNLVFDIEYELSATGKQDFVYTNAELPKVSPAWQQAKDFCQFRLNKQVKKLIENVLLGNSDIANPKIVDGCMPGEINYQDLYNPRLGHNGLLLGLQGDPDGPLPYDPSFQYDVYNEKISCNVSESKGTFSLSYSATVKSTTKYKNEESMFTTKNSIHTYNTKINTDRSSGTPIKTLTIQGNIKGLTPGGLIQYPDGIELPSRATSLFLLRNRQGNSKYQNALECFKKICNYDFYNQGKNANMGKRDLKPAFKEMLRVANYINPNTLTDDPLLDLEFNSETPRLLDPPHPTSFNITQNYNDGSIDYNVTYSNNGCDPEFRQVSIQVTEPVEVIASFSPPGSSDIGRPCPIIQRLGTQTSKRITISISGLDLSPYGVYNIGQGYPVPKWSTLKMFDCECDDSYLPIILPVVPVSAVLTQKSHTHNPVDGTYSINLSYVVAGSSCEYSVCPATNFTPTL